MGRFPRLSSTRGVCCSTCSIFLRGWCLPPPTPQPSASPPFPPLPRAFVHRLFAAAASDSASTDWTASTACISSSGDTAHSLSEVPSVSVFLRPTRFSLTNTASQGPSVHVDCNYACVYLLDIRGAISRV